MARCYRTTVSPNVHTLLVAVLLLQVVGGAANYGRGQFGSLVLCPPGGPNFMMAWSLACEMKRRKRRDTSRGRPEKQKKRIAAGYRPATLMEIQKICCEVGCEIRDLLSYCDPFGPWNSR